MSSLGHWLHLYRIDQCLKLLLYFKGKMDIRTTYSLTAVAVQDISTSDRVELRLTDLKTHTEDNNIDVRVNSQHVHFDGGALMWQDFKGYLLYVGKI